MSMHTLLTSLFKYKAWANDMLFGAMISLADDKPSPELHTAIRILNHAHIVDRIFVANLQSVPHTYGTNEPLEVPPLAALFSDVRETDQWYIDYVSANALEKLAEEISFEFTDGKAGRMSRAEMLAHVVTHGGYHRGEVGRLLPQISHATSGDVFAGYLHRSDPSRRAPSRR